MDDKAPRDRKSPIQASNVATNVLTIAYFVFALFPVFWILLLSLKPDEQLFTTYFIFDPTLENYKTVLGFSGGTSGIPFTRFFVNSLIISFGAVAIALVVAPLVRPGIAAVSLISFIFAWNNFVFPLILTASDAQTVTVGSLSFLGGNRPNYNFTAAAALIAAIPPLILAFTIQRYLVRGLSFGAVKG